MAEARVLYERRTARGQIACGAVAEPAAPGLHVDPLRDGELGPRSLNIGAKGIGVASRRPRVDYPPTVTAECVQILGVGGVYVKRDLKALIRAPGQVDELAELVDLEAVGPAAVLDRPKRPAPGRDRCEAVSLTRVHHRPVREHNRLADR